jgi:hypothetical protein
MDWTMTDVDRAAYRDEIGPWLPERILDFHVHVRLPEHTGPIAPERIAANWAMEVDVAQPWGDLRATYGSLFADRDVSCVAFGAVYRETFTDANNAYILAGAADPANRAVPLMCTRPEWPAEKVAAGLASGFAGIKPYPDFVPGGSGSAGASPSNFVPGGSGSAGASPSHGEVGVFDFLPDGHLRALDDAGGVLMLHLPRAGRLGDPANLREVRDIRQRFPCVRMVIAHVGRAYCLPTAQRGLPQLASDDGIFFDTSANLNADVFRYALDAVGPARLLYGSDLPVTLMRGVREHVGEKYINFTSETYGWNTNRKAPEVEAQYTFFLYEELRALICAVERAGLGKDAMRRIMHDNGAHLLRRD